MSAFEFDGINKTHKYTARRIIDPVDTMNNHQYQKWQKISIIVSWYSNDDDSWLRIRPIRATQI